MELGLRLGEALGDAGRELVLGLGVGPQRREEEVGGEVGRTELELGARRRCSSPPEPSVRLSLLPLVPNLGFPWPPESRNLEASARGFDVNQAPSAAAVDSEDGGGGGGAAVSTSPTSAASFPMDFSTHRPGESAAGTAPAAERSSSRASDEDESGSARKKLRLSKEQSAFLEESFKEHSTLNPKQKQALAKQLNLRPRQVEVWFQNRRARTKLKQTEVDCEYLKRCCETLTEENRRLQKELAELRALKTAHPFYMHLPATTLSMCPSCERVASTSNSNANSSFSAATAAASAPAAAGANAAEHRPSSFAALLSAPRPFPFAATPATARPPSNQPPASS